MTRAMIVAIALCGLAGCGVDGEPVKPNVAASIGIGTNGVNTNLGVGVSKGPLSVFLGL